MTSMQTCKATLLATLMMLPCATYSNWPTSLAKGIADVLLAPVNLLLSPLSHQPTKRKTSTTSKHATRTSKPAAPKRQADTAHNTAQTEYTLSEVQAHEYIDNIIASFDLALRPHVKDSHLIIIKQMLKETIGQPYTWTETKTGKRYKKDIIDQYVNAALVQYIVRRSFDCALKCTKNEKLSMDIAGTVFNTVVELIQKKGSLDMEELIEFLGKPLKKAIKERVKELKHAQQASAASTKPSHNQSTAQAPAQRYPSEECCACFENFENVCRVFLSPCGHDMCTECACNWFFGDNSKTSCPKCRATVNLSQLAQAIQAS